MRVAVCRVGVTGAICPPRHPSGDVVTGGEDMPCILAGSESGFEVPAAFQVRVVDLAVEPGQHGHELAAEQGEQPLRVVAIDQDWNGLE
jgi:hypothetical protein